MLYSEFKAEDTPVTLIVSPILLIIDSTLTIPTVWVPVVSTPTTVKVFPIPYADPPSMILTAVIAPELTVIFAVAFEPVVEPANPTNCAL